MRTHLLVGGGGLTLAACVVVAVLLIVPGQRSDAAVAAVRAATAQLEEAQAVRMNIEFQVEDDANAPAERQSLLISALRGVRMERGRDLLIYNAPNRVKWEYHFEGRRVLETPYRDPLMLSLMLSRARVEQNFETLRLMQPHTLRNLSVEHWAGPDGRSLQRISAEDEHGRPIRVELDRTALRLLRTESCTHPGAGPVIRTVITYEYPDPASLDPALFERPAADEADVKVEKAPADSALRVQCMVGVRSLCMGVFTYAQEHEDRLPTAIDELARYAPQGDLKSLTEYALPDGTIAVVRYLGASLPTKTLKELDPAAVLFECTLGDVLIRGFGDGHAETVKPAE